ncbi:MAG: hypothetical protein GY827_10810, partial [Cytophagales bacterium]|nr:hypothetical protein [Cytophagales bacterium]
MIRTLRNVLPIVLAIASSLFSLQVYAQCSEVPVVEAVRNGDFELGYLPGSTIGAQIPSHTFTPGGPLDFESDLNYSGEWKAPGNPCLWGMANQYGVGRVENTTNPCGGGNAIVYGRYANANLYKDHTLGTNKGFAMIIDYAGGSGYSTAWAQTVDVFPSQLYYFSAWFAQYGGNQTPPTLRFRVEAYDAGGALIETQTVGTAPVAPPAMTWQQFNGTYSTPANAVTAKVFIECQPTGQSNSDDFMIDDISFINGCQNIESQVQYTIDFDKDVTTLCYENGSYNAQILRDNGTNLGAGTTVQWYQGDGTTQTELTGEANNTALAITSPGTYRACVTDGANNGGCTVNATVVVTDTMSTSLADYELCDPIEYTLDDGRSEAGLVHTWTGQKTGSGQTIVADEGGEYTVTVNLPGFANCTATATSTVVSNLPDAPNLEYCDGGGETSQLVGPISSDPWKWCEDADCNTVIGQGTSVDWTPAIGTTGDQTLYMQSAITSTIVGGTIGKNTGTGDIAAGSYTNITVLQTVLLESVKATVPSWASGAQNRSIEIRNLITGDSDTYGPFNVKANSGVVNVNAILTPGNYRIFIRGGGVQTDPVWNGDATLYSVPDYVDITGYSKAQNGSPTHGPFKQLTFKKTEACKPIPVVLTGKSCCNKPADVTITQGATAELCAGDNITLTTNAQANTTDYLFAWFKDAGTTPISNGGSQANNIDKLDQAISHGGGNATYTIVVSDKGNPTKPGCQSTASIDITDLSAPTASNAGSVATICADNTTLAGNAVATGETGEWTVVSGSGTFTDANDPTTTVTGIGTGDNVYK